MTGKERRLAAAKKFEGQGLKKPKSMVYFGPEEKALVKAELGLSDSDLEVQGTPSWVYILSGVLVISGIVTAVLIAKK